MISDTRYKPLFERLWHQILKTIMKEGSHWRIAANEDVN